MTNGPLNNDAAAPPPLPSMMHSFATPVQPLSRLSELKTLCGSPRELWVTFAIKFLDSLANFSMHIILVLYLTQEFAYSDVKAGAVFGAYGALITAYGIGQVDHASCYSIYCRSSDAANSTDNSPPIGNSFMFPTMMIAIRRYTVKKNRNFVYGLFYTTMIIAIFVSGPLVDLFRLLLSGDDNILPDGSVEQANTVVECILCMFLREIKVEEDDATRTLDTITNESDSATAASTTTSTQLRTSSFVVPKTSPLQSMKNTFRKGSFRRYMMLGIILTNIKVIWRHLDATLPKYMIRKFGVDVPFGSIIAIEPLSIMLSTPIIAFFAENSESLPMVLIGVSVASLSPIFVVIFPNFIWAFCIFLVLFGLSESIWSPRYYSMSVCCAKEGHEGVFAAFAFAPTFLAQLPVGALSGFLLSTYCPNENYCNGTKLWGVVFGMALLSPLMMMVWWRWLNKEEAENEFDEADADDNANVNNDDSLDEPLLTTP
ncbi:MFS transporter [Skeletonema marinoi]|uniref:MFS transporter n=1 Tax=Skeletonema marinoi TaxID=267567 RepID=A0AAD8YND8_9STRA|nr:MFS transporter [Skeletonema marinoi]